MTSVNYPNPVTVNGYSCKNCTDVDYAKKNIDPSHPKDGPFGVNAKDKPAVTFGGVLANVPVTDQSPTARALAQGARLDISA